MTSQDSRKAARVMVARVWKKAFFAAGRIGDGDGERALARVSAGTGISNE